VLLGSTGESWRCICSAVMIFQYQFVQDHGHYTKTRALELTTAPVLEWLWSISFSGMNQLHLHHKEMDQNWNYTVEF